MVEASRCLYLVVQQLHRDDGRGDGRRSVDDLLDTRHALRDIHRRHAGEVECLQGHLRGGLAE